MFDTIVDRYPESEQGRQAVQRLAWIARRLQNHATAAQQFLRYAAFPSTPDMDRIESRYLAAEHLHRADQIDHAIAILTPMVANGVMSVGNGGADLPSIKKNRENATFLLGICCERKSRMAATEEERDSSREQSRRLMEEFVDRYSHRVEEAAICMSRLGSLCMDVGDRQGAVRWLRQLTLAFADTAPARQGAFTLGCLYLDLRRPSDASETFRGLVPAIDQLPRAQLLYIGGNLYQGGGVDGDVALAPNIVLAAASEILRRIELATHPDSAELRPYREYAWYYSGESRRQLGEHAAAVELYDAVIGATSPEEGAVGAYYFHAVYKKGLCLQHLRRFDEALACFDEVVTYINRAQFPGVYYRSLYQGGNAQLLSQEREQIRKSVARFLQIANFADSGSDEIRPWIEKAYLDGAVACALLGERDQSEYFRQNYQRRFPTGQYLEDMNALPEAMF